MQKSSRSNHTRAFSLIELGVVLIVIGLLIGAVVGGKSLVRAAELRSVITDANQYIAAMGNFKSQYRYLPGDMPNATNYWASALNGNADGLVGGTTSSASIVETQQFWGQLSLAGFIDKTYTGLAGAGGYNDFVIGSNIPASRIAQSGFSAYYLNYSPSGVVYNYTLNYGTMLTFGGPVAVANAGPPTMANLTPVDAFTIDTKADDGLPATGKWIANLRGGGTFGAANACSTSASTTDYTGSYRTTNADTATCSFFIITGF
jgi:type II secretory pathway pseudopilin PulG